MGYKALSRGLGIFSIGLGAIEMLAPHRITRALQVEGKEGVVKAFGAREIVAGFGLMQSPAHSARVWNRVAGDVMDLTGLGVAARQSPRNKAVWGALGFVVAVTLLDTIVASGLDRETGKTLPAQT